jgi:hypothetical protein
MSKEDHNLEDIYNEVILVIEKLLNEKHDPLAVAAVFASQALGLYKTVLSDKDYNTMVKSIVDKKDRVQPFESRSLH